MANNLETLYIADDYADRIPLAEQALLATSNLFEELHAADRKLAKPIIDREVGIVLALKPDAVNPEPSDDILYIGQIGEINEPNNFEKFILKAVDRAFNQRAFGRPTDTAPLERLARIGDDLHNATSASFNGMHVSFTGPWAQHSRLLAVRFAETFAGGLGLPAELLPSYTPSELLDDEAAAARLAWLNQGQNSGDNSTEFDERREQFRFVFDLMDR